METNCAVLSPQEYRLQEEQAGRDIYTGRMRPYKILKSIQKLRPIIDVERARYFTESMKQTEGQMLVLRWAKAMHHIAQNITVYIDDNQLLVGRSGAQGRS